MSWRSVEGTSHLPGYSVFSGDIERPDLDDRDYRVIELQNGLRAVLIHDASADKAAACLTVAVGSMQDPRDMQGLAHFCEHMITKGSEQFPEENDFMSFVFSNGGTKNAVTGPSLAYYWFSIGPSHLTGGLGRLAGFFQAPHFKTTLTSREIYAVDSECKRNAQNDRRRVLQVHKTLTAPGHPYSQFGTGNFESITEAARKLQEEGKLTDEEGEEGDGGAVGRETRRRLVEWWREQYCAGRMTLAVLGRESLDELTDVVAPLFSPIVNRGLDPRPIIKEPFWGPSEMGTIIYIKTVKDYYDFNLTFLIPDQAPLYETQPARVLAHFLGHEGPGSVCTYLKKKGWLVSLSASVSSRNRSVTTFKVDGTLTKEGYANYREVLTAVFNYISLLRSSALEPYHFDELHALSTLAFRFREKAQPHSYANALSYSLSEPRPPEHLLSEAVVRKWDEDLVRATLDLLRPELGRVTLEAREHPEDIVGEAKWEKERWYGVEYCVKRLEDEFLERLRAPNDKQELHLPRPNPFTPENLSVEKKNIASPAYAPTCIRRTVVSALWYKADDQFWVPKAEVRLEIRSPSAHGSPRQAVLTRLLADLVEDALSEIAYDAELAGLTYSISSLRSGLSVSVGGYADKLPVLLRTVLEMLKNINIDRERLKVIAEQVKLGYDNFYLGQPSNLSETFASYFLTPTVWTPREKAAELSYITASDVQKHKEELLSRVFVQSLVLGSIAEAHAIQIAESIDDILSARAISASEQTHERGLLVPEKQNIVLRKTHAHVGEANSSLSYWCQFGFAGDTSLRRALDLIAHMVREPCFTQLRTQEQLGYVVSSSTWLVGSAIGLGVKVQSTRAPWVVEDRVEAFLKSFREELAAMDEATFESKKQGLVVKLLEKPKNLREETARFWGAMRAGHYDFARREADAAAITALTREEVLQTYDRLVAPSSAGISRKKVSIQLVSQQMKDVAPAVDNVALVSEDVEDEFKASLGCYPAVLPVFSEPAKVRAML
ncbi:LuxS/MPP-like metallohydrolase [Obba rivulosa]|uniref:LuxS/MPP-like metallohydrolase n=1 Tax=Obba rivulosa TaxID=1052685 RepID=A0A8E2AR85_9APHY|nr:LuxS/MPP-like metallohydrolase [Obba rivulosa]